MKSPIDRLTADERAILAHFHSSEEFLVLRKLIDMERLDLAKDHVNQFDLTIICNLSGQSNGLKKLVQAIQKIHKDSTKKEKKS